MCRALQPSSSTLETVVPSALVESCLKEENGSATSSSKKMSMPTLKMKKVRFALPTKQSSKNGQSFLQPSLSHSSPCSSPSLYRTWYIATEYQRMEYWYRIDVKSMEKRLAKSSNSSNDAVAVSRANKVEDLGLRTSKQEEDRQRHIQESIQAVLQEQREQQLQRGQQPELEVGLEQQVLLSREERIAQVYRPFSLKCHLLSQRLIQEEEEGDKNNGVVKKEQGTVSVAPTEDDHQTLTTAKTSSLSSSATDLAPLSVKSTPTSMNKKKLDEVQPSPPSVSLASSKQGEAVDDKQDPQQQQVQVVSSQRTPLFMNHDSLPKRCIPVTIQIKPFSKMKHNLYYSTAINHYKHQAKQPRECEKFKLLV